MSLFWLLHGIELILIVLIFLWWFFDRRRMFRVFDEKRINAYLSVIEKQVHEQLKEWSNLHTQIETYLKSLEKICSKAEHVLKKSSYVMPPTLEESELKAVAIFDENEPEKSKLKEPELGESLESLLDKEKFLKEQLF